MIDETGRISILGTQQKITYKISWSGLLGLFRVVSLTEDRMEKSLQETKQNAIGGYNNQWVKRWRNGTVVEIMGEITNKTLKEVFIKKKQILEFNKL